MPARPVCSTLCWQVRELHRRETLTSCGGFVTYRGQQPRHARQGGPSYTGQQSRDAHVREGPSHTEVSSRETLTSGGDPSHTEVSIRETLTSRGDPSHTEISSRETLTSCGWSVTYRGQPSRDAHVRGGAVTYQGRHLREAHVRGSVTYQGQQSRDAYVRGLRWQLKRYPTYGYAKCVYALVCIAALTASARGGVWLILVGQVHRRRLPTVRC